MPMMTSLRLPRFGAADTGAAGLSGPGFATAGFSAPRPAGVSARGATCRLRKTDEDGRRLGRALRHRQPCPPHRETRVRTALLQPCTASNGDGRVRKTLPHHVASLKLPLTERFGQVTYFGIIEWDLVCSPRFHV